MTSLSVEKHAVQPSRNELAFHQVIIYMVAALALSTAPYIAAWALTPPGKSFSGALFNPDDVSVYISAMRQGATGEWLFHYTFSPESSQPHLLYMPYILAGKLFSPFGQPSALWFNLLRIIVSAVMLSSLVFWVRQALPGRVRRQLTAWQLIVFGAGLGWLPALFLPVGISAAPDLGMPEWTTFMTLFSTPHFALGLGFEVLFFVCVARMTSGENDTRWVLWGALAALALGLTYPFNIPVVMIVTGTYLLALAMQERRLSWRMWVYAAVMMLPAVGFLFYYGVWTQRDTYWQLTQVSQNVIKAPPIWGVAIGYGLIGALAVVGAWQWWGRRKNRLVPIWAAVNLLALYLPVTFSARFALGLMVPLGTLAAYGLEAAVLPRMQSTRFFNAFARLTPTPYDSMRRVIILLTLISTVTAAAATVKQALEETRDFAYYLPDAEIHAASWLAENTDRQALILSSYPVANYLPRIMSGKVFLGQQFLTVDLADKGAMLEQFWDESTLTAWRETFLREWGITHVYQGRYEQSITVGQVVPPGEIVYQADGVTIYRVHVP
jgi:hypothetical protein